MEQNTDNGRLKIEKSLIMRAVKIEIPMPQGAAVPASAPQVPAPAQSRSSAK
jgi:hypothetical protein